ncbi:hypothetical protein BGZ80_011224 [Entomortierella chlamydospora]|uniref:Uncharacterized protein n=1 Tax=Entomortierella chlamydospora TaxID=101097 RepID=A0A9P6MUT8_9FUNG|nr:hypothetical protein BGZ79_008814 [Entomortierella chlamydospora]KAG0013212.1 hypothetical protein BGZ80_011224 [Entomortierella chlamydospora]
MGRRLSMFCPCLPRKQRDNLSSRSLYPDQDSSGPDDYTDEDEPSNTHSHYHYPRAQLESLGPSYPNRNTVNNDDNTNNPWPSRFSNGRFSRHANRASLGSGSSRKPNPFRTPYKDDYDEEDSNDNSHNTSFAPYHDDSDDDDDNNVKKDYRVLEARESREGSDRNAIDDSTKIHARMEFAPYRVQTEAIPPRKVRAPRNPHGRMAWYDDEEFDDAEEVIDVDALIAEQDRITRELAAQEEALRKEEEEAIVAKRLAAIKAAEKRGLLRFEGDRLVIPNSTESASGTNSTDQEQTVQGDEDNWGYSSRTQRRGSTSSAASSFVGGIDAFNQELKMMSLDIESKRKREKANTAVTSSSTVTVPPALTRTSSTSTSTSTSTSAWISSTTQRTRPRTVSTSVSTSTSTSTNGPVLSNSSTITPRNVLSSVASFLKKVDGVIAGDGSDSDDEATPSSKREQKSIGNKNQASRANGPHETLVKSSIGESQAEGGTEIAAVDLVSVEPACSDDLYNSSSETNLAEVEQEHRSAPVPEKHAMPNQERPVVTAPAAQERIIDTLTSIFNTGSSIMGYFGGVSAVYKTHEDDSDLLNDKYKAGGRSSAVVDDDDDESIDDYNF